jgi:1,2-diacylglycerol 3-alpha-glucosyltransferase
MKIGILFDRFGPYHIARFRGAMAHAEVLAIEGAPHRSIYGWTPPSLPKGLDYVALTKAKGEELDRVLIERRLDEQVAPWRPDSIALPGWSNLITLTALRWCRKNGIPAICMSETNSWDFKRGLAKEQLKRGIVAQFGGGLATNTSQMNYLAKLGLPAAAIFSGYNAIDNDYFSAAAGKWRRMPSLPSEIAECIPAEAKGCYFLASNRFIPKKNLIRLLKAYAAFRADRGKDPADWPLVLLGDGEMRDEIEALVAKLGIQSHVYLPGFLQLDALVRYYGTAGAFIHVSTTEQWGLVINEAMAAGLPVAASNRCGATHYLIEDGVTGYSFDPLSTDEIKEALMKLAALPADSEMLRHARAKVDELRPERFGDGLIKAAQAALENSSKPGLLSRIALDLSILRAAWNERA